MEFSKFLKEEENREEVAKKRKQDMEDYIFHKKLLREPKPKGAKVGSPEWIAWATKNNLTKPSELFRDEVENLLDQKLIKLTGKPQHELLGTDKKSINVGIRMIDLIMDFYKDGTSVEDAANMLLDFFKSQGYF